MDPFRFEVARADRLEAPAGSETLMAKADLQGVFTLRVEAQEGGHLRLCVQELGKASLESSALHAVRELLDRTHLEPEVLDELPGALEKLPATVDGLQAARVKVDYAEALRQSFRVREAAEAYRKAQPLVEKYAEAWELGYFLHARKSVLFFLGRQEESEPLLNRALEIWQDVDFPLGVGVAWNDLGVIYHGRGELSRAGEAYEKAKALACFDGCPVIKRNIIKVRIAMGDTGVIPELEKQIEGLRAELDGKGPEMSSADGAEARFSTKIALGQALSSLASAYDQLADLTIASGEIETLRVKALAAFDESVARLAGENAPLQVSLSQRADFLLKIGEAGRAREDLDRSRRLIEFDDREEAYFNLAQAEIHRRLGESAKALDFIEKARPVFEELGIRQALVDALSEKAQILRGQGEVHQALESLAEARSLAEKMRLSFFAETFRRTHQAARYDLDFDSIDMLAEIGEVESAFEVAESGRARSFLDSLTEPLRAPHAEESAVEINNLIDERVKAQRDGNLELEEHLASKIKELQSDLDFQGEARLRRLGEIKPQTVPFSLAEIRAHLDHETTVLSFALGEERSWLFRMTRDEASMTRLPGQEWIERAVANAIAKLQSVTSHEHPEEWLRELGPLSEALFRDVDLGKGRLAIIPDGGLHRLPFAALPKPSGGKSPESSGGRLKSLLADHEILVLPSASALVHLRVRSTGRPVPDGLLGLLADPVYGLDDERLGLEAKAPRLSTPYARLPESGREAQRIASVLGDYDVNLRLGFKAQGDSLLSEDLARYRWLHFATHTFYDEKYPDQMSMVVSYYDQQGREQRGSIPRDEIARLDLPVELVTLSACESALGEYSRGAPVNGLAQAFLSAGATRVVASLWRISDNEETARLMEAFYLALRNGQAPSAALRRAQLKMARESPPQVWAAFVFMGPWDPTAPLPPLSYTAKTAQTVRRVDGKSRP